MDHFENDAQGRLFAEQVSLERIAGAVGTPCYVYSDATITRHFQVFDAALAATPHLICYSVKANSSQAVLATLARLGSGADVVSGGEIFRALRAGIAADKIVFSGVGKRPDEIEQGLRARILLFNVESLPELRCVNAVAERLGVRAPVALRVNPDVDPGTHPYIATGLRQSKFGIPLRRAWEAYEEALALPHVEVRGIDCHVGSQLTSVTPILDSIESLTSLARRLMGRGVELDYLDIGGGLGIRYSDETPPSPADYGRAVAELLKQLSELEMKVICEPGRVIMGNAGVLLTRVLYRKRNEQKRFVVVDAAMNDLLRPALYGAFHAIRPLRCCGGAELETVDVVGPVCESSDFLARDRPLPPVAEGDLLAVMSAGAYGYSMASNYNSRPRPPEVLVKGDRFAVVRARESQEDLVRGETLPPWL